MPWIAVIVLLAATLSRGDCSKKDLYIGAFLTVDISDGGWSSAGVLSAIEMAINDVNNSSQILANYNLKMEWKDTKCKRGYGVRQLVDFIELPREKSPIMLIGGGCSIATEATAEASRYWNLIQIPYSANSMSLSDKKRFPLLFRTCYSEQIGNPARLAFLRTFGWKKVATVYQNEGLFTLTMDDFQKLLDNENVTVLTSENLANDPKYQMLNVKSKDARIIIGMFYANMARKVFCYAFKEGMYGRQYQWLIPGWFGGRWWEVPDKDLNCTPAQIKLAAGNYIAIMESTWSSDPRPTISHQTASVLNRRYFERVDKTPYKRNEYCVFGYDAVWAVALTLNKSIDTLRAQGKSLEQFNYNDTAMTKVFKEHLQSLHYLGMSGEIRFDRFGDRIGKVNVKQLQGNSEVVIGEYNSHTNIIEFKENKLVWQGGSPPLDQIRITFELVTIYLPLYILVTILAVLGIILATGFLFFNIYFSDRRFIRMSSPRLNSITVVGCILIFIAVIINGLDGQFVTEAQFSNICQINAWIMSIGFTLAYGAMFSKTWRVHILFLKKLERRSIRDHQLLAMVASLLVIDIIVLTAWQVVDPPTHARRYLPMIEDRSNFVSKKPYIDYCSSEHPVKWRAGILGYKGILLIFGAFLAWETRNVTIPALNDSKNISVSVYTVVLCCVVGLPVLMTITDLPSFTFAIGAAMCLMCTTITLCLMFVPKILMIWKPAAAESSTLSDRAQAIKNNTITPVGGDQQPAE